jgi:hypothetical protein
VSNYRYRGIAILSTVVKLFQLLVYRYMYEEDGCQVDLIYTDISKAFDKVRHHLLLDKMSTDVEPSLCQWLGSYVSGRIQRVKMGDCASRDMLATLGVPQGSHLGPLCFIWFVNEISRIFRHKLVLFYADDMKLFLPVRGFQDCLKIQSYWNRLVEWCEANALKLNVGKCKSITFSRLRHPIEFSYMLGSIILDRVDSINDLGVIMDSKVSFTGHIDVTVGRALTMLGFVKRLSCELSGPYTLKTLYVSRNGLSMHS